jgi:hypothetical protein
VGIEIIRYKNLIAVNHAVDCDGPVQKTGFMLPRQCELRKKQTNKNGQKKYFAQLLHLGQFTTACTQGGPITLGNIGIDDPGVRGYESDRSGTSCHNLPAS